MIFWFSLLFALCLFFGLFCFPVFNTTGTLNRHTHTPFQRKLFWCLPHRPIGALQGPTHRPKKRQLIRRQFFTSVCAAVHCFCKVHSAAKISCFEWPHSPQWQLRKIAPFRWRSQFPLVICLTRDDQNCPVQSEKGWISVGRQNTYSGNECDVVYPSQNGTWNPSNLKRRVSPKLCTCKYKRWHWRKSFSSLVGSGKTKPLMKSKTDLRTHTLILDALCSCSDTASLGFKSRTDEDVSLWLMQ